MTATQAPQHELEMNEMTVRIYPIESVNDRDISPAYNVGFLVSGIDARIIFDGRPADETLASVKRLGYSYANQRWMRACPVMQRSEDGMRAWADSEIVRVAKSLSVPILVYSEAEAQRIAQMLIGQQIPATIHAYMDGHRQVIEITK